MSEMADMSRAIRTQLQRHGPTLHDIPADVLNQYVQIVGAFYYDLKEALERRRETEGIREEMDG